ncbi:MAG: single-stranded DNA-binding protein [bacterium]|nr:single-stranded DNA-binding protein [bacterium]MDN5835589.1 single-stranded DNA-binding protein [bacterium]
MGREESIQFATKYLGDMLTFFGVNLDIKASVEEDVIELSVASSSVNSILIGQRAETLRSIQYIVSSALRHQGAELTRVNVDIADYKAQRAERVAEQANEWIAQVRKTGDTHVASLNPADRRIVHRVAAEYDDIMTFSEGEGHDRKIIIAQKSS